jgi:thiol:disulfide interchange protein DsbD
MRIVLSFILSVFFLVPATAQFQDSGANKVNPVKWQTSVKKESNTEYQLIFKADIKEDWHIYSQGTPPGGPLPMTFKFEENKNVILKDSVIESETKRQFNKVFGVDEVYFSNNATLTQNLTTENGKDPVVKVTMSYQVCKQVCLNEEFYFAFNLKTQEAKKFDNYDNFKNYKVNDQSGAPSSSSSGEKKNNGPESNVKTGEIELDNSTDTNRSVWGIFFGAFLAGFAALLTPCVFPMIPMTVSFFTKQSKSKAKGVTNAIIYGFSIVVIYVVLGTVVTTIFGADSLNALSTNVTFNIIFFLILVVFAVSFLGAFDIMLPTSWTNKVDKKANKGGLIGIFFMALALAIVSFSCTGPLVGTILVQAASKGGLAPIIGMLGFSLAIAIPFALFAAFPGWMNSLPKSGGWLNSVKVVLGFLELAMAFKFLSNADLVLQTHLLEREVFLAIWIAIFGALAFYLFGKISLPHDSPVQHISVGRLCLGLITLTFVIYLIPGLWGAPLKLISGFPPPMSYSESPSGVGYSKTGGFMSNSDNELPENAELGEYDIISFHNYQDGVEYAKKVNKPILLDFTGYACVNCRKMEQRVWGETQVLDKLKNDVVLISLYVDSKKDLPEGEQYTSETTGKRIRTIGNKWSDFQIKNYGANAQPYYVMLTPNEELLSQPVGYTPDVEEYNNWLKKSLENFEK